MPTFADRGEAIAKRLEAVKADPKYQALSPEHKARVREDIYNKYVPASYAGFHLSVPDKKTWVEATGRDTSFIAPKTAAEKLSATYRDSRTKQGAQDVMVGAAKSLDQIGLFGARVANKVFSELHGIDENFSHKNDSTLHKAQLGFEENVQRKLGNFIDSQHARIQSEDFWLQTHPRDTVLGKLASSAGEFIATLPLYEAVGSLGAGAKVSEAFKASPLTAKLAQTSVGKFVAKRLTSATDMYLASLVQSGGSNSEAVAGAVGAGVIEGAAEPVANKLKIAAAPLIKKWTANTIAMGGKPFAQDIMQSAYAEMQPYEWWAANAEELGPRQRQILLSGHNIETNGTAHELGHGIAIFPKSETEGHFVQGGKVYSYEGPRQRQTLYDTLAQNTIKARELADPVMAKLHEAEKTSLDSIAIAMKGKPLSELTDVEHTDVLVRRHELIEEAAQEAPAHLPDLLNDEHSVSIENARKQIPELNNFMAQDEKMFGAKFADTLTDNDTAAIKKETGISNANGATKKLKKAAKETGPRTSASLNASEYGVARSESAAYLKAPRNRAKVAEAVSDRSKAGLNKFIDLLKEADGSKLSFESPTHRLLYHYSNRKQLPPGMSGSLLYRIRQLDGYEHMSAKDIQKEADWLHAHLLDMAHSGHLGPEKNVFRSSKFEGPFSWTKWQKQLSKEADTAQLESARAALAQHPTALKGFNSVVRQIQKLSTRFNTPSEYIAYRQALSEHAAKARIGDITIGGIQ